MLRHVLFDLALFMDDSDRARSQKRILWLLEALTHCNQLYLQQNPDTPLIYQSGIKYKVPAQYERERVPEVGVVRAYLEKNGAPNSVLNAFKTIADQVGVGECFRDIPRIIENGGGDCLPVDTLVEREDGYVLIGSLRVGDRIRDLAHSGRSFVSVERIWPRSEKATVTLFLNNGKKVISSLDHRHMLWFGNGIYAMKTERIKIGDELVQVSEFGGRHRVVGIEPSAPRECVDITTSSGTFYLPEADVLTHNCDNVAAWRTAELREVLGIEAKPYITWRTRPDGGTTYHVIVRWPDGTSEDPSLLLGMSQPERAADRAEEQRKLGERMGDFLAGLKRTRDANAAIQTVFGGLQAATPFSAVSTPQNFNQLQYTIPFQTDDSYEDWSPTRPQGFYFNPLFPGLPSTPGGMPMFNTRMRDPDDDDRFDGDVVRRRRHLLRRILNALKAH